MAGPNLNAPARSAQSGPNCAPDCIEASLAGAERLGFPLFLYCINRPTGVLDDGSGGAPYGIVSRGFSDKPLRAWQQSRYADDPLRRAFLYDFLVHFRTLPLLWENRNGRLSVTDSTVESHEHEFMQQCYADGVCTGINIPIPVSIGQLAVVSFFSDVSMSKIRRLETKTARLFLLGHQIHRALAAQHPAKNGPAVRLSPRELECMRWVAKGKNASEIAMILGISVLTARDYLKNVSVKLNTVSRAQALAKLLTMGCLDR